MSEITTPPDEVVTNALLRQVDLSAFGASGSLALITLDNGHDHTRPNTFGIQSLNSLNDAITAAESSDAVAIAIIGKPFIFAAGADLSGISYVAKREQSLAFENWDMTSLNDLEEARRLPLPLSMDLL